MSTAVRLIEQLIAIVAYRFFGICRACLNDQCRFCKGSCVGDSGVCPWCEELTVDG